MDPETAAAQRVGTTICNKWTLERLIGTGGMAAVYVANHKIGRQEAIKILHTEVARDPELRARFEQEANAVNRFKHPGMVEVRDIDVTEDGAPFLVMELLEGQPLSQLARSPGGVEIGDLLRWVDELLDVLAAAHAQGIIHRDIKPDNLFVLHDGRLKVLDFGIARVRDSAAFSSGQVATTTSGAYKLRTKIGATLGTAPYMPPEQIRGIEIDGRADLFAVGATMFRLIARRRIHEAGSEAEMLVKMASQKAPPLASVAPQAAPEVCLVVDRALMFDREQRYPEALTMQGDVRAVRAGQPPPYASARVLEMPSSSSEGPSTRPATAVGGVSPDERTAAASPGALNLPPLAAMATVPALPTALAMAPPPDPLRVPVLDQVSARSPALAEEMPTRPAMMVLGASALKTPLSSRPAAAAPADPGGAGGGSDHQTVAAATVPAATGKGTQIMGERTLRSELGPEAQGHSVSAQGYAVATPLPPKPVPPKAALPPTSISLPGPLTQQSGMAPRNPPAPSRNPLVAPAKLAPGESIPVVAPPKRRYTFPGTDISLWPLVGVGVVFAAIGVGITLWLMLRGPDPSDMATYPIPTTAPTIVEPKRPAQHGPTSIGPLLGPAPQPPSKPAPRPHR